MATKRVTDMTPEEHARVKEQRKKWKKKKYIPISELSEKEKEKMRSKNKEHYKKKKEKEAEMSEDELETLRKKRREWYAVWREKNKEHLYQYRKQYNASKSRKPSLKNEQSKLLTRLRKPIKTLISTLKKILTKRKNLEKAKELYWKNPEKFREKRREWINKNREKKRLADKEYNAKRCKNESYKAECSKRYKLYRKTHKDEIAEKRKLDRQLHPEKYKKQRERYRERHLEEIKRRARKYYKTHRHIDLEKAKKSRNEIYLDFEKYASRLSIDEEPIKDDNGYLMVRDFHTKEYFYPRKTDVINRIRRLEGKGSGECHLYASEKSKRSCPVYRAHKHLRFIRIHHKPSPARDPAWRDMVISRADGHCERCGKECDSLIAHHKVPVASCAMMAADIDNGMALCPECHREVHSTDGCRLHELAAEKRKTA